MLIFPQTFLIFAVVIYVLLSSVVYSGLYEKFLFYPMTEMDAAPTIYGIQSEVLSIAEGQNKGIEGWYFKNPASNNLVIVSHGNAGNISHRIELARHLIDDTSASILLYDYQGYGNSKGHPSVKGILQDGLAAYDYATERLGYKSEEIVVYGESLGCAVSCYIASQRKTKAIILQSPFRSLPAVARDCVGLLKVLPPVVFPEPRLNNEKLLRKAHAPLLIMHGKHDEVIPFKHGEVLYREAAEPKKFVALENSGHNDTYLADSKLFDTSIKDFFKSLPNN